MKLTSLSLLKTFWKSIYLMNNAEESEGKEFIMIFCNEV